MTSPYDQIMEKGRTKVSVRVYMLLDIVDRSCEYALRTLRSMEQVVLADRLEGYPNIIATIEAVDRQNLAAAVMPVLDYLDGITEGLRLLVTHDDEVSPDLIASGDPMLRNRNMTRN